MTEEKRKPVTLGETAARADELKKKHDDLLEKHVELKAQGEALTERTRKLVLLQTTVIAAMVIYLAVRLTEISGLPFSKKDPKEQIPSITAAELITQMEVQAATLNTELVQVRAEMTAMREGDWVAAADPATGALYSSRMESIDQRIGRIEQLIESSPEKAMAIPLLQKDVQRLEDMFGLFSNLMWGAMLAIVGLVVAVAGLAWKRS